MMNKSFKLKILSPEKPLADVSATQLQAPGLEGQMGVMPDHTAIVSGLQPGVLTVYQESDPAPVHYYIGGGYLQFCENEAVVLAEVIQTADELDKKRADAAESRALDRLAKTTDQAIDIVRALNSLERARARKKLMELAGKG